MIVYVDDFKMAGPKKYEARLRSDITGDPDHPENGGIYMGAPQIQTRFLGCDHIRTTVRDSSGNTIERMEYNMQGFFEKNLDRWAELTGQDWRALPDVAAPFLDEDALRKKPGNWTA